MGKRGARGARPGQSEAAPQVLAEQMRLLLHPASGARRAQLEGFARILALIAGEDVCRRVAQLLVRCARGELA